MSWQGLNLDFTGVVFDGGDFRGAQFSGGTVSFGGAEFSDGLVGFDGAQFSGSTVRFTGAQFTGGLVSFTRVNSWSYPPAFDWDGKPPQGVTLPPDADIAP